MHGLRRNEFAFVVAGALILTQSAQSSAGESTGPIGKQYFFCSSAPDQPVVYFSDFFVVDVGGHVTTSHNAPPGPDPSIKVQDNFFAYLKHEYAFRSNSNYPTGCPYFGAGSAGLDLAQASKKNLEAQYKQAGKKIVETGWKYTSGKPHNPH